MSSFLLVFTLSIIPIPCPMEKGPFPPIVPGQVIPAPQPQPLPLLNPFQNLWGITRLGVQRIDHRVYYDYSIRDSHINRVLDLEWFSLELQIRFKHQIESLEQVYEWCDIIFGPHAEGQNPLYGVEVKVWGQDALVVLTPVGSQQRDRMTMRYLSYRNRNTTLLPILTQLSWISPELGRYILRDQFTTP